jgi:hypothetical protein
VQELLNIFSKKLEKIRASKLFGNVEKPFMSEISWR